MALMAARRTLMKYLAPYGMHMECNKIANPSCIPFSFASRLLHQYTPLRKRDFKNIPAIDWEKKGALQEVFTQKTDNCWVVPTVNAVQSLFFIRYGRVVNLCYKEINAMVPSNQTNGFVDLAYNYIRLRGLSTTKTYGCELCKRVYIDNWDWIPGYNVEKILATLAKQPLVATIVIHESLMYHSGKIYNGPTLTQFRKDFERKCKRARRKGHVAKHDFHFVLIVGYEVIKGTEYLKCQNSWGLDWGHNGFFYVPLLTSWGRYGMLDIFMGVGYPIISDHPHSKADMCNKLVVDR